MSVLLVGNKTDLESERVVSTEEGEAFAREHEILFMETSAKTAFNVDQAFIEVSRLILTNIETNKYDLSTDSNGIKVGVNMMKPAVDSPSASGCSC
jgi:GTPase SAR1 family protein